MAPLSEGSPGGCTKSVGVVQVTAYRQQNKVILKGDVDLGGVAFVQALLTRGLTPKAFTMLLDCAFRNGLDVRVLIDRTKIICCAVQLGTLFYTFLQHDVGCGGNEHAWG